MTGREHQAYRASIHEQPTRHRRTNNAPYLLPCLIHAHGTFGSAARAPATTRTAHRHRPLATEEAANAIGLRSCEAGAPRFLLCPDACVSARRTVTPPSPRKRQERRGVTLVLVGSTWLMSSMPQGVACKSDVHGQVCAHVACTCWPRTHLSQTPLPAHCRPFCGIQVFQWRACFRVHSQQECLAFVEGHRSRSERERGCSPTTTCGRCPPQTTSCSWQRAPKP